LYYRQKLQTETKHILRVCSTTLFQKSCRLSYYVEIYYEAGQATDDNIIGRMGFAFWVIKATVMFGLLDN